MTFSQFVEAVSELSGVRGYTYCLTPDPDMPHVGPHAEWDTLLGIVSAEVLPSGRILLSDSGEGRFDIDIYPTDVDTALKYIRWHMVSTGNL